LGNNYWKLSGIERCIYWYQNDDDEIILGAEFDIKPECLVVKFSKTYEFRTLKPFETVISFWKQQDYLSQSNIKNQ
jgi:hypothetical protein